MNKAYVSVLFIFILVIGGLLKNRDFFSKNKLNRADFVPVVTDKFFLTEKNKFSLTYDDKEFFVETTLNEKLEDYGKHLLRRYKTPFSAFAVIDNNTGNIIGVGGRHYSVKRESRNFAFSSTHPAASLSKIVSSVALFDYTEVKPSTMFSFNGRGTTLYKYQLKSKKNKWTRRISFEKAFNYSNNVIFGKAAIENLPSTALAEVAGNLGFNQEIVRDLQIPMSQFNSPSTSYQLAEFASGFNKKNTISVVHAAYLSFLAVTKGEMRKLNYIKEISLNNIVQELTPGEGPESSKMPSEKSLELLEKMMISTVKRGTARGSFNYLKKRLHKKLVIGAKTGSITGGFPHGKHEWITVFAKPKNSHDQGISVAVLNINKEKWYVRSGYIAKNLIEYYFNELRQMEWNKITQK